MQPLVSVIMPVYNQELFVAETIESVLGQTFSNFEFLILDDGSSDGSASIIRHYATLDKRIVSWFEKNTGKCIATNTLASRAKGKYLAFLDADDLMLPERLEKQLLFHENNAAIEGSSCHCYYINAKGQSLGTQCYPFLKTKEDSSKVLQTNETVICAFTGMMTTRESYLQVGGLRSAYWPCEDMDFVNRYIEQNHCMIILQEILMKYRIHSNSITATKQWHLFNISDYTRNCIVQRRAGLPEKTFEEFMQARKKDPWWSRVQRDCFRYSQVLHKKAGFSFYSKKYGSFIWQFAVASFLAPRYVFATIKNRFRLKLASI
jgi:glycosyltransferase involved in cell wall biosynthesis